MPMVHVNLIKDAFDDNEKQQLLSKITEVFESIKGEDFRQLVTVLIHEVESGHVAKAGNQVTLDKVREYEHA